MRRRAAARTPSATRSSTTSSEMPTLLLRQFGHLVPAEDVVDELLLLDRQQRTKCLAVETALVGAHVLLGEQEVDSVWASLHLLLDPRQIDLELLGCVCDCAEDPEAAGVRDGGDDVAAVA